MKALNKSVAPGLASSPALVAFFVEANRLADVARERAAARESTDLFPMLVDVALPLIQPASKRPEAHSQRPAGPLPAKPKLSSMDGIRPKPLLPRTLLVMQFNSRLRLPQQKLTFRVGR